MWIVRYALRRPYSIAALALLILIAGVTSYLRLPVDVMPNVDIPSVKILWIYNGLNASEMASKVSARSETAIMNNVDNVLEISSLTVAGVSQIRVSFQPDVDIPKSLSQITAISQTILKRMPQGMNPPQIIQYNQSRTPIIQLVISSSTLPESRVADFARLQLRSLVQSIPGVLMTLPYGAADRQIMIDLKPEAIHAQGITAADVTRSLSTQNSTLPSGTIRENEKDLQITLNTGPDSVDYFNMFPIKSVNGRNVLLRDIADVRDGTALRTNVARVNGEGAVIVSLIRIGNASTLEIIRQLMERLPEIRKAAPEGLEISPIFDQSVFVSGAMKHIQSEILIVGSLVALAIVLFLGSWRATLIVLTSIPLSLLSAVFVLHLTNNTLNLVSLGGLALAIGILVDNALVEIENITRHVSEGMASRDAALKSASEVAFPELVSTLSTCVVFSPIFMLTGVSGFIFRPMAIVVMTSLLASYLLSRTVVPCLAMLLIPRQTQEASKGVLAAIHHQIERLLALAQRVLDFLLRFFQRLSFLTIVAVLCTIAVGVFTISMLGRDFFPRTDAGLMRFYVRTTPGLRVEKTAETFSDIQRAIRRVIPEEE
ncbi:MAG: efflux RND transporter permease subunit, partial [Burkholderiaceae bacterium]|nr:efflux RND transporter permease subunit [Burkholderiaceae bacterium]